MFPYPSGSGLHVGHPEGYTATDIYAEIDRMKAKLGPDVYVSVWLHSDHTVAVNVGNDRHEATNIEEAFARAWAGIEYHIKPSDAYAIIGVDDVRAGRVKEIA